MRVHKLKSMISDMGLLSKPFNKIVWGQWYVYHMISISPKRNGKYAINHANGGIPRIFNHIIEVKQFLYTKQQ